MKKQKTFIFSVLVLALLLLSNRGGYGQTTILSDNFGTTSQNPISRTGWTANSSGGSAWELRTTSVSSGYTGASGGANVFTNLGANNNTKQLTYDNSLSTVGYTSIQVKFGGVKTATVPNITILYSTDGANYFAAGTTVALTTSWALYTVTLPSGAEGASNLRIRFEVVANNSTSNFFRIDDFVIQGTPSIPTPTISVVPTSLTGLDYIIGNGPSSEKTYTISGSNLDTNKVTINSPADFLISTTSGANFTSSIVLTPVGGTVDPTPIYIILKSGLAIATYNENITYTNALVANQNVNCIGSVTVMVSHTGTIANFPDWTHINCVQGNASSNDYIQMLTATSSVTTPIIDFSGGTYKNLSLKARTFGGISGSSNVITISVSTDGGSNWSVLGTRTPLNTTLTSMTNVDISAYVSSSTKIKFETLNATGSIGVGIDDIGSEGALPITLQNFTGNVIENNVKLNWKTTTETNNSGFDVERKTNTGNWLKVGNVKGAGNSSAPQNYNFEDRNLQTGKYSYRLKQIDFNGNYEYFNLQNEVTISAPKKFALSQNYPNPFNPTTKISYTLPADMKVEIKIYDLIGKEILTERKNETVGYHEYQFDGTKFASGIYFYKITAGENSAIRKMILIK